MSKIVPRKGYVRKDGTPVKPTKMKVQDKGGTSYSLPTLDLGLPKNKEVPGLELIELEDDKLDAICLKLLESMSAQYEFISHGNNRAVFMRNDDSVIKVASNHIGLDENSSEVVASRTPDSFIPMADTEWWEDEFNSGLSIIAEYVDPIEVSSLEDCPNWVGFVDCGQVGYTKDGRLVAYDL